MTRHPILLTFDKTRAAREALQREPGKVSDTRFLAKSALIKAFGREAVRPFRLFGEDAKTFQVLALAAPEAKDGSLFADRMLAEAKPLSPIGIEDGAEIALDLDLLAYQSSRPRPGRPKRPGRAVGAIAERQKDGTVRVLMPERSVLEPFLTDWAANRIARPDRGFEAAGAPELIMVRPARLKRRDGAQASRDSVEAPHVRIVIRGRVTDAALLTKAIEEGIGQSKDYGFGSVLPRSTILEAAGA